MMLLAAFQPFQLLTFTASAVALLKLIITSDHRNFATISFLKKTFVAKFYRSTHRD